MALSVQDELRQGSSPLQAGNGLWLQGHRESQRWVACPMAQDWPAPFPLSGKTGEQTGTRGGYHSVQGTWAGSWENIVGWEFHTVC